MYIKNNMTDTEGFALVLPASAHQHQQNKDRTTL